MPGAVPDIAVPEIQHRVWTQGIDVVKSKLRRVPIVPFPRGRAVIVIAVRTRHAVHHLRARVHPLLVANHVVHPRGVIEIDFRRRPLLDVIVFSVG